MLDEQSIENLLGRVARREVDVAEAVAALKKLPFEDLGFARVDHHRHLRSGHLRPRRAGSRRERGRARASPRFAL